MPFRTHTLYVHRTTYYAIATDLTEFWERVNVMQAGLADAVGCYIFFMRESQRRCPWYVGFAETQPFKEVCFTPDKLDYYHQSLGVRKGLPYMTFIAKCTERRMRLVFPNGSAHADIRSLHTGLIANCRKENPELRNQEEVVSPASDAYDMKLILNHAWSIVLIE